jgi:hypothetical protein
MRFCAVWIEQCEAAKQIEAEFGTQIALRYLIGEKFLNFLQAAETDAEFRAAIPAFVGGIRTVFETWQLAEYLEVARQSEPFDPSLYEPLDEERKRRKSTLMPPKMSASMNFNVRLPICSWWNRQDRGSWGKANSPRTVGQISVSPGSRIKHADSVCLR